MSSPIAESETNRFQFIFVPTRTTMVWIECSSHGIFICKIFTGTPVAPQAGYFHTNEERFPQQKNYHPHQMAPVQLIVKLRIK